MPNLMGVTNPVPGQDNTNINRQLPNNPNTNTNIQNAPNLDRVNRMDNRTEQQLAGDSTGPGKALRYDSNFQAFMQKLRDMPELGRVLAQLMLEYKSIVSSGMQQGIAQEMAQLLKMLPMNEKELGQFFKQQLQDGERFNGPLFNLLREAYSQSQSETIKGDILQFLKRYADYTSSDHIQGNLIRTLTNISRYIPASFGSQLLALAQQLGETFAGGDRAAALKMLQSTILPFLSNYTEKTHDMGMSRTLISQLALDISRFENGSTEGLLQAFKQLIGHNTLRSRLGNLTPETLLNFIKNSDFVKAPQENDFANQLTQTIHHALRGDGGIEAQESFRDILQALLINESVYMPLKHMLIPVDWQDKMMFSELWIDPDAEDNMHHGGDARDNTFRLLFKIDIQGLGFFDIVMASRGEEVEMLISCPEEVAKAANVVQGEMNRILTENGLRPTGVQVLKMQQPLTISAVFPKIAEGENSLNVQI